MIDDIGPAGIPTGAQAPTAGWDSDSFNSH
jgi:hypothetical protein